jgi:hypothetical protein
VQGRHFIFQAKKYPLEQVTQPELLHVTQLLGHGTQKFILNIVKGGHLHPVFDTMESFEHWGGLQILVVEL